MSTYALSMDCPRATVPEVLWKVRLYDIQSRLGIAETHNLYVPSVETWTLDTLRMFLHDLQPICPHTRLLTSRLKRRRCARRGERKDGAERLPRFSDDVSISVLARGWEVTVWTNRNEVTDKDGKSLGRSSGEWSEPMQAVLLDLAAKSPFPMDGVRVVDCADARVLDLKFYARRDVIRGVETRAAVPRPPEEANQEPDR